MVKTNCVQCGKELIRKPCRLRERNYCNASCQMTYEYANNLRNSKTITSKAVAAKVAASIIKYNSNPTMKLGKRGYYEIYVPLEGWKKYHIHVWEKHNCKKLPVGCCIHHKDENKLNNNINNLQLMSISEHNNHHRKKK